MVVFFGEKLLKDTTIRNLRISNLLISVVTRLGEVDVGGSALCSCSAGGGQITVTGSLTAGRTCWSRHKINCTKYFLLLR